MINRTKLYVILLSISFLMNPLAIVEGLNFTEEQPLTTNDFESFDYIIAMDSNNFGDLKSLPESSREGAAQLFLMRDFDEIGKGQDVPDPYYGGDAGFELVLDLLEDACQGLLNETKSTKH